MHMKQEENLQFCYKGSKNTYLISFYTCIISKLKLLDNIT